MINTIENKVTVASYNLMLLNSDFAVEMLLRTSNTAQISTLEHFLTS